jgi:hypothetical protein
VIGASHRRSQRIAASTHPINASRINASRIELTIDGHCRRGTVAMTAIPKTN